MLLTISYWELSYLITPDALTRFKKMYKFVYFLPVNNNKTNLYFVDNIIFENQRS